MNALLNFVHERRTASNDCNITGIGPNIGKYIVSEDDYERFLELFHSSVFGKKVQDAYSLLEKHRDVGPPLVDLDLHYEKGGLLERRHQTETVRNFVAEYIAAMVYFSEVETLEKDLIFYHLEKPAPESDANGHKDGIHIQCPTITTMPKFQFGIRGFLLSKNIIGRLFEGMTYPPEKCYDHSVIHQNSWFLYGATKPNKAQYKVVKIWRVSIADVRESLDGSDPTDFDELLDIIKSVMTEQAVPTHTLDLVKTLSIRRGHTAATPLALRKARTSEWEELMIHWGNGKAKPEKAPVAKNTIEDDVEDTLIVTEEASQDDVKLAYRLARDCLHAERRAGEYQDWVNLAICLKNISNTEESFRVWCEVTRKVDSSHKKAHLSEAELKTKWMSIRIDPSRKQTPRMPSMYYWAREDNPEKHRSILSEKYSDYIINFAKMTHVSVASVVCEMYKHEFKCSMGARKGMYLWYQFVPGTHAWKQMRTAMELRSRFSSNILNEYIKAGTKLNNMMVASTDDAEKERIDAKRKNLFKIERELEMTSFKDNVLKECQEKFYDDEFIDRMNSNPYLVGVVNGVLDLRHAIDETSQPHVLFRDGRPDDNVSFQMGRCDPDLDPIPYVPYHAEQPEQQALQEFFAKIYPDPVLRDYVLTLLASCLEGANKEQKFYVMQGPGSNGKSMIEYLMEVTFGDYGTSMSTTVMTRKRPDSGAANPDIITVKCKRYIHTGEPDDNEKINTAIMKQYSGGDRVPARGLFSEQEKFVITGKIFMSCNDLPPVSKMDGGTWRRIRVIPHVSIFKDAGDPLIDPSKNIYEKDLGMERKLRAWRMAFLSLLVHYYDTRYLVHGLKEPPCVGKASDKYKEENDVFMSFFSDMFVKEPAAGPIAARAVRLMFQDWKRANPNVRCDLTQKQVMERMKEACGGNSTEKEFWGVSIATEEPEP